MARCQHSDHTFSRQTALLVFKEFDSLEHTPYAYVPTRLLILPLKLYSFNEELLAHPAYRISDLSCGMSSVG